MAAAEVWRRLLHKRPRFSVDELRKQYATLTSNEFVNDANKASIVEAIRSIAELLAWGEQHNPVIFEHCMEHNIIFILHRILLQQASRRGVVAKQVLQTLNIMLQNVHSELGLVFMFSNNGLSNIIELNFDMSDDEVLGHYVSLLKTVSSRIDSHSIQFFFGCRELESQHPFPLYQETVKLVHHKEAMVRAAARTAMLNILSIHEQEMQRYISRPPSDHFFTETSMYLTEQLKVGAWGGGGGGQVTGWKGCAS
jgi:protein CLEC16A